jgi:hypothetical protein
VADRTPDVPFAFRLPADVATRIRVTITPAAPRLPTGPWVPVVCRSDRLPPD